MEMEFGKKVVELDVNDVLPNRFQPRIKFNEDSINELCESIKEHGVIQPIVVRAMGDKYEIIAGERRYKASLLAGKQTIPAVITNLNDKDSAEVALIENVQRKDLTPIEEAISYKKILDMGYLTQEELAVKLGKNQSTVANKLRLLNLDEEVQEAVLEEKISERHARSLLKLSDMSLQRKLLKQIIENRLTVRKTDEEINKLLKGDLEDMNDVQNVNINPVINEPAIPVLETNNIVEDSIKGESPIVINDEMNIMPGVTDFNLNNESDEFNPFNISNETPINNDLMNTGVNIPTTPIEDAPIIPAIPVVEDVNPGFVNIENIENNAKDINVEKEEIDINSLLKPSVNGQEEAMITSDVVEEEKPEEELKVGKFFSLPDVEEETVNEEEKDLNSVLNLNNSMEMPELPVVNETMDNPSVAVSTDNNEANMLNDLLNPNGMADTATLSPVEEKLDVPSSDISIEQTVPVLEEDNEITIPLEDVNNNLINPDIDFNLDSNVERMNIEESIDPINDSKQVSISEQNNIVTALSEVRNKVSELEKQGYRIDTEEFDFETEYQIIIKITK